MVVRAVYEVPPANWGRMGHSSRLGDLQIGGTPIVFGGQLAEKLTMKFIGRGTRPGSFATRRFPARRSAVSSSSRMGGVSCDSQRLRIPSGCVPVRGTGAAGSGGGSGGGGPVADFPQPFSSCLKGAATRAWRGRMAELIEPILETSEIQGNIIPGFNKSHQGLLGYRILDPAGAKAWLRALAPRSPARTKWCNSAPCARA